jgi:hypothetical protein
MRIPRPSRQRNRSRASSLCLCMIASGGTQRSGCCPPRSLTTASDIVHRPALSIRQSAPQPDIPRHIWVVAEASISAATSLASVLAGSQVGSHVGWAAAVACGLWWNRKPLAEPCIGRMWTPMDTAWPSTDQEVGCSSRPGRARQKPLVEAVSAHMKLRTWPPPLHGRDPREPFSIRIRPSWAE